MQLSIVPFSHLDLSWLGTQKECESRTSRILTEVIRKAEKNPDYRFFVDSVYMLQRYMTLHPEQLTSLKKVIKTGQLEINPLWAIPHTDENVGESNVRNILYAKKFLKENFDFEPIVLSYTDLPEWMVQTPQILQGCGIEFVLMNRLGPGGVGTIPLLWWEGLDGSEILTASIDYQGESLQVCGITIDAKTMKMAGFEELCKLDAKSFKTDEVLSYLGRDLWLPVENLERNIVDWNKISDDVKVRLSTFSEYYEKIKDLDDLPVFRGEVPDAWMFHKEGIYAKSWQEAHKASNLLLTAEKCATIADILGCPNYPGEKIEDGWKWLSRSEDHNYDGAGKREGDTAKFVLREKAILAAQDMVDESLSFIAERVKAPKGDCVPIVVFNPLSVHVTFYPDIIGALEKIDWQAHPGLAQGAARRADGVTHAFSWPTDKLVLEDGEGDQIDFQKVYSARGEMARAEVDFVFIAEDVPPLGYKTYYVYPSKDDPKMRNPLKVEWDSLENQYISVDVNHAQGTFSVHDKDTKKALVDNCTVSLDSYKSESVTKAVKATSPDRLLRKTPVPIEKAEILERGPIRARLRLVYAADHPCVHGLYTDLSITKHDRLEVETIVKYDDFESEDILLVSQLFRFGIENPQFHYGVPYGHSGKEDVRPGLMEEYDGTGAAASLNPARYATNRVIQRWLDVTEGDFGFTIASNRHMFAMTDDNVECLMLAISTKPDKAEVFRSGRVVSRFSVTPHCGDWRDGKSYRSGWELNSPLIAYTVNDTASEKVLPPALSFISSSSDHDIVTVLKKEENGGGIVVRLFEAEGRDGETKLTFFRPVTDAYTCSLLEEKQKKASLDSVQLKKNEIKTLRLSLEELGTV